MAKIIIGIHGLANKPERTLQARWWVDSIREGLQKNLGVAQAAFEFADVYWADLMYPNPLHHDADRKSDPDFDDEPYVPARALVRYDDGALDELRAGALDFFGGLLDKIKGTLGMDATADAVLKAKLKDLAQYYDPENTIRDRAGTTRPTKAVLQEELANALEARRGDDIMLIAHSMGSIIAYDVLRNLWRPDAGVRVSHFVTIGSPLGLPHVKLQIQEDRAYDGTVRTPSIVTHSWVNFADKKDPVAFDTHLADDYGPNANGIGVRDDLVLNDYEIGGKRNHHKLFGYLRAPEVSEHILGFLNRSA